MSFAKTINKGGTDKTVIHDVRAFLNQPIEAPDWTDLRVGWFLSVCGSADPADDDRISGAPTLAESFTQAGPSDKWFIGIRNTGTNFPGESGVVFLGYTNHVPNQIGDATSLVSSDLGIGTTNSNYWRPKHGNGDILHLAKILDGESERWSNNDNIQTHFVQNIAGAGGYAVLHMLRFTRPSATSNAITMTMKQGVHTSDVLYTSTPSEPLIRSNLEAFPTTVQTFGPVTLSAVPDSIWLYWPFRNSRLRNHCCGFVKVG